MLRMETVTERMADYVVGQHPTMPGSGKTPQAVDAARCLEDSAHASMMTSVPLPGKTTAAASSTPFTVVFTGHSFESWRAPASVRMSTNWTESRLAHAVRVRY